MPQLAVAGAALATDAAVTAGLTGATIGGITITAGTASFIGALAASAISNVGAAMIERPRAVTAHGAKS